VIRPHFTSTWHGGSRTYEEAGDIRVSADDPRQQVWRPPKRQNLRVTISTREVHGCVEQQVM